MIDEEPCFDYIPDGEYPMTIDGELDHVRVTNGGISCCNWDKAKMTHEAQNIALAEACGFAEVRWEQWCGGEMAATYQPPHGQHEQIRQKVPDFFRDLNAQHKAWQKLTDGQRFAFRNWVSRIAMREGIWAEEAQARFGCECLLRALGKWIE